MTFVELGFHLLSVSDRSEAAADSPLSIELLRSLLRLTRKSKAANSGSLCRLKTCRQLRGGPFDSGTEEEEVEGVLEMFCWRTNGVIVGCLMMSFI